MRQLWRLMSSLRVATLHQHRALAPVHFPSLTQSRSFWKPGWQPLPVSGFAQWSISPLLQTEQRRTFASKVKKYKIKSYTAYKGRFKLKANGEYKRWRAGKRHNAHSKTNKQLRQLRRPAVVHSAYATVMKKLNFKG